MSRESTRPAAACPEPSPSEARYTQIPRELHALAETPREFELMAALLSFRWFPTSPIIPSVKTLAEMLRCSTRTVRRTAAGLEARGLVARVERRAPDNRQMSNHYVLCGELLALVSAVEAGRDQDRGQAWQGRRTNTPAKKDSGNYQTSKSRPGRPDIRAPRDYYATSEGVLPRRT